jgi:hypothetical protein
MIVNQHHFHLYYKKKEILFGFYEEIRYISSIFHVFINPFLKYTFYLLKNIHF